MQGKTEHTHKKLPQSSGSKSKPNDDGPSEAQSPSNQIRKVLLLMILKITPLATFLWHFYLYSEGRFL